MREKVALLEVVANKDKCPENVATQVQSLETMKVLECVTCLYG